MTTVRRAAASLPLARVRQLAADPRRVARRFRPRRAVAAVRARDLLRHRPPVPVGAVLTPAQALRENGFTVFRGLYPAAECAELAARLKAAAGIVPGVEFTRVDATNKFPDARGVLFDARVLDAVRGTVGAPVRFLQVSDLHYLHDTAGWHRDSVHRASDCSASADWSDEGYRVVKAILYLESENAAMGIMAGSHLSPLEIDRDLVKALEKRSGQLVLDDGDEPNRRFSAAEKTFPMACRFAAGDLLVFDERMYHAGRRVDGGLVTGQSQAAKFTLSLVFGPENHHSYRLYSYFRYARRELHYKPFPPDFAAALAARGLLLEQGLDNYYLDHPEELRLAHLRHPETMDGLVAEFTRLGAARRGRPPA